MKPQKSKPILKKVQIKKLMCPHVKDEIEMEHFQIMEAKLFLYAGLTFRSKLFLGKIFFL